MNDITRLAFIIIAAAALVSCGSPAPQSVLFGEIAAVHTRWTAAQKRHKADPVAAVCRAPFEADLARAADAVAGRELRVVCEAPLVTAQPLSLTMVGLGCGADLEVRFRLAGNVMAGSRVWAPMSAGVAERYARAGSPGAAVLLVGTDDEGHELYELPVGRIPTHVEGDRVVISAGTTMRAEAFGIDASMADACLGATMLRVRLAD